jgi:ribosomal protein L32
VSDAKTLNFCQKCGEFLIEKRMPMAEKALGETRPPLQRWCPKCRAYRD